MLDYLKRSVRLVVGLFVFAFGVVMTYQANLGNSPYEVLNSGLANHLPMQVGTVSTVVSFIIVIADWIGGEAIGFGTIANSILVGVFMNLINALDFLPLMGGWIDGLLMLVGGLFVSSIGTYLYVGSGFGAGPRDSLMVMAARKLKVAVGTARIGIEVIVTVIGLLLSGKFGIGTFIAAFVGGISLQLVCGIVRFDLKKVRHESILDTIRRVRAILSHTEVTSPEPEASTDMATEVKR